MLVKVTDFGLARLQGSVRGATLLVDAEKGFLGSPDYVSPEQARNSHAADIRSDLYSLGCSFYFALTARQPFRSDTVFETVVKHLEEDPEPLELMRPEVPAGIAAIVRRLMAKDPARRFQTPAELIAELAFLCSLEGTRTAPPPVAVSMPVPEAALMPAVPRREAVARVAAPLPAATRFVAELAFESQARRAASSAGTAPDAAPVDVVVGASAEVVSPTVVLPSALLTRLPEDGDRVERVSPVERPPSSETPLPGPGRGPEGGGGSEPEQVLSAEDRAGLGATLRGAWGRWTEVVALLADGGDYRRVDESAYRLLYREVLESCRALAGADPPRRVFFRRVESLVEPWVTPLALASAGPATLHGLLDAGRRVERELGTRRRTFGLWKWAAVLVSLAVSVVAGWYLHRVQSLAGNARPSLRSLWSAVEANPVLGLTVALPLVILISLYLFSR